MRKMQIEMAFGNFLAYRGDKIDIAVYVLAIALQRTNPEQEDVLVWNGLVCPCLLLSLRGTGNSGKIICGLIAVNVIFEMKGD